MSDAGYAKWLGSIFPWPGPRWQKFWAAIGASIDEQNERLRVAAKAGKPLQALDIPPGADIAYREALDLIGGDRQISRGGTQCDWYDQEDDAYAADLHAAWDMWRQHEETGGGGGSVKGLLLQLKRNGFPVGSSGATVVNHLGLWYQLDNEDNLVKGECMTAATRQDLHGEIPPTPLVGFTRDVRDQFFSHFMLLFLQDIPLYNTVGEQTARARLNSIVRAWKPANAIYDGAVVLKSGALWGWPTGTKWGDDGLKWGSADGRFIEPDDYKDPWKPSW